MDEDVDAGVPAGVLADDIVGDAVGSGGYVYDTARMRLLPCIMRADVG